MDRDLFSAQQYPNNWRLDIIKKLQKQVSAQELLQEYCTQDMLKNDKNKPTDYIFKDTSEALISIMSSFQEIQSYFTMDYCSMTTTGSKVFIQSYYDNNNKIMIFSQLHRQERQQNDQQQHCGLMLISIIWIKQCFGQQSGKQHYTVHCINK